MKTGDRTIEGDWLVEYDEISGTYQRLINLHGMTTAERVAVVIDGTAALGTPEVIYRRKPCESEADAAARLRAEVMQTAGDVLRVLGVQP